VVDIVPHVCIAKLGPCELAEGQAEDDGRHLGDIGTVEFGERVDVLDEILILCRSRQRGRKGSRRRESKREREVE